MTEYNVHILRPESLSEGIVEDAFSIIEHSKGYNEGPVKFYLHPWDYEPHAGKLEEDDVEEEEPRRTIDTQSEIMYSIDVDYSARDLIRKFREAEVTPALPIGKRKIPVNELLESCKVIARDFRKQNGITETNNLVIVTTTQGNTNNFFAEGADIITPTALVQINHTVMQEGNPHLLLTYYMAAMPLKALGFNDPDYINKYAHQNTKGCMNDLGAEDVYHLRIKTKTADICETCKKILSDNKVPYPIISQLRGIFGLVRKIQINIEDFEQDWTQPRVEIGAKRLGFPDNGLVLRLSPKEMSVYVLFMKADEGIHHNDMGTHQRKLMRLYGLCYNGGDPDSIRTTVGSLCDISNTGNLRQTIAKCNAKIKKVLGEEMCKPFLIGGNWGELKSIKCDRTLVEFSNSWGF
ncbi:MAG: hypothetical protein H8E97_04465 [Bacteroidetes bacterium]|nr:hypothetical protein [Bacteroidota bacterium]